MSSIRLRSGRVLNVRPIRPDDQERLSAAYAGLSPESQYRRFLGIKPKLTAQDARYLVDVDAHDHVALVATSAQAPEEIVAVARFVRLRDDRRAAEFAIVVDDNYQGDGLGSVLMGRLAQVAVAHGVERFWAMILADNEPARRLVGGLAAAPPRWRRLGSVSEVEFELLPAAQLAA